MSAAEPPQGANSAPMGGSVAATPQAWGGHTSIVRVATRTDCRRRIGRERLHEPSSVGAASDRGVTLVDVLVGLAVAMLTVVVVYQTFVVVESIRRSAAAAGDTEGSGAFALFALAVQTENAGAGLASAARWLDTCPPTADIATTLRPIDVLITDGGGADRPDSLVIRQSRASNGAAPAAFAAAAPPGADFRVESADGFSIADRVIAISRTGSCAMAEISAVVRSGSGILDIAHSGAAVDFPATSLLLNLGPAGRAWISRYDLLSGTLRSTDVANGDAPNPLVSNLANVKFQYGIDNDGDGALDTWVTASPSSGWSPTDLLAAPRTTLERIKAIRIGVIAHSEQIDRTQTRGYHWVLFDCELADKSACPGRLEGTVVASAGGGYRYRAFETVVPLRNGIWNSGS